MFFTLDNTIVHQWTNRKQVYITTCNNSKNAKDLLK